MVVAPSCTGQRALLPLPSKSFSNKRSIGNYSLPDSLVQDKASLKGSDLGLAVLKVNKVRAS